MNIEIKCTCGFESRGKQDVVVSSMLAHCVSVHNIHAEAASILAKARPAAEPRPPSLGSPGQTRPEHPNLTALGLQTATWAVGALSRRAKSPATSRAAALLEQHLRSTAARYRAGDEVMAETVEESSAGAGEAQQRPTRPSAPPEQDSTGMTPEKMLKLQRKQAEDLMALRGMEGAINQFSGVKMGLGPHF
jgi:hypothetical protein